MNKGEIKMKFKKIIVGSLIALLIIGGGYMYFNASKKNAADKEKKNVVLPPVKASNLIIAEGTVVPVQGTALSFSVPGTVAKVFVKEGEQVKKGQLLIQLDNEDLKAQLEKAKTGLAKAKAGSLQASGGKQGTLLRAKSDYTSALASLERKKQLFKQEALTQQELDDANSLYQKEEAALKEAQGNLDQSGTDPAAKAEVAYAQAAIKEIEVSLAKSEIRAPFDGTIAFLNSKQGEYIQVGAPIIQLAGLEGWEIETSDLTELNIAQIKEGDTAALTFDAIPDLKLNGKISHIRIFGEKKNGDVTYTVRIKPDQQDKNLKWNMTAIATINSTKK
jgi:multidrug resistance efflux pump